MYYTNRFCCSGAIIDRTVMFFTFDYISKILRAIMASKLVDHISFQVKKLIVGVSPSKKEAAPKDALVTTTIAPDASVITTTVAVHEMLFGAPMQMEHINHKNEDANSCIGVATQMEFPINDNANEDVISGVGAWSLMCGWLMLL